jgi:hypothetical protein
MTKKGEKLIEEARAKWDDTICERDVIAKFDVDAQFLRKLRREKKIRNYRYLAPSSTNNPNRPGRKVVYSLIELTQLFSPVVGNLE